MNTAFFKPGTLIAIAVIAILTQLAMHRISAKLSTQTA